MTQSLGPSGWPEQDRLKFWDIQSSALPGNPLAEGQDGAITTAINGLAARAGLEALKQGGSACDAVLTAALTQIALGGGAVVSYFGIGVMMHYDASSGQFASMNAGWNTCLEETEPMTIPGEVNFSANGPQDMLGTEPSGRTAMVGGFMKAVESAHARYGKLPFSRLFEAAIEIAEDGFPVSPGLAFYFSLRAGDLARLEETRSVFLKPDGSAYLEGEVFKQPALAATLRAVAENGADYMYRGAWAKKAVDTIQREGGKMTLDDLDRYDVLWDTPVRADFEDYTAYFPAEPCTGTAAIVECLHLVRASKLKDLGHWSKEGRSLKRLAMCCGAAGGMRYQSQDEMEETYPGFDMSFAGRLKADQAEEMWRRLDAGETPLNIASKHTHSDNVVAIDKWGNMATLCHTINCLAWGKTAICIDGITIGDPASYQQSVVAATGCGNQMGSPIEIGIIARGDQPIVPWCSMGVGLHYQTAQNLTNIMSFGMDIESSVNAPGLLLPMSPDDDPMSLTLRIVENAFDVQVLEDSGLDFVFVPEAQVRFIQGLWVAVERSPETGTLRAVSPKYTNGWAAAI